MRAKYWLLLTMLLSSPALAESRKIESFHDPEHAFVGTPDGSFVPAKSLGLEPPFVITGQEQGQYLFQDDGQEYRVFVPEVVTSDAKKVGKICDLTPTVLQDDYQIASARGVEGGCQ